ncbi:hypothetical protein [Acinetobacter sp. YH12237]|uniref:hypothetical protein n=1 Tax=Acinetobacter sp. YH12237 TaxID=2601164 RepID=UPI0015D1C7EA|nr:hypothetical protein [Acinetobacter sp. YH12237]
MLNRASLERKEFKEEELAPIKKLDLNDLKVPMPKNLDQLLIWTSELAQYNHAQFLDQAEQLKLVDEDNLEEQTAINQKIRFYRGNALIENQIKDFYLKKLLEQGEATVKGYIKSPTKKNTRYAVISYHDYDFVSFATPEILSKFPADLINFVQKESPKTLADIYSEEAILLSAIKKFIKPFKEQYKKLSDKNREIKEHNTVAHEIFIKIKNKEATLQKSIDLTVKESSPKSTENSAVPVEMKQIAIQKNMAPQEKPITVIKKRKFALNKDK